MNHLQSEGTTAVRWRPGLLNDIVGAPDLAMAAAHLAACGIPVFPCVPGDKRPLTARGFHDASTDLGAIRTWWRRSPAANIGVPTGAVGGIDVVDVDVHETTTGFAAFERARRTGLLEGWAWLVRTPSGGLHAYFLHAGGQEQRSWQVPSSHIDFRGDGGYIIVPPSQVTEADGRIQSYRPIASAEHDQLRPVDAAGLRGFLDPPRPARPPTDLPRVGSRPDKLAAWVASRAEGGRNGGLFWAACRMAEEGHDLGTTTSLLGDAAEAAGLPQRETQATIRSAYRTTTRPASTTQQAVPARPPSAVEAVGL